MLDARLTCRYLLTHNVESFGEHVLVTLDKHLEHDGWLTGAHVQFWTCWWFSHTVFNRSCHMSRCEGAFRLWGDLTDMNENIDKGICIKFVGLVAWSDIGMEPKTISKAKCFHLNIDKTVSLQLFHSSIGIKNMLLSKLQTLDGKHPVYDRVACSGDLKHWFSHD